MRREDYTALEVKARLGELWMKEHSLTEEDVALDEMIRKMPIEIIKFSLPRGGVPWVQD